LAAAGFSACGAEERAETPPALSSPRVAMTVNYPGYAPFALPPVLKAHFGSYTTGFVWRNLPPAFVFTAVKQL